MTFRIITADERMKRKSGVKALIMGPSGIGKTTLLRTLDPDTTLFFDLEAGDLAVQDFPVDQMTARTWKECRNLACLIGGPNPALPSDEPYSQAHYDAMLEQNKGLDFAKYETIFVDSITVASRLCKTWAKQQEKAKTKKGEEDKWAIFGLLADEMLAWLTQLQHIESKNVVFLAIMDRKVDDFNRVTYSVQMEGGKTAKDMPGILDQVITYELIKFDDEEPIRCFVNHLDNPHGFIAKDRSGRLDLYEKPHLGELLAKITNPKQERQPIKTDAPVTSNIAQEQGEAA